jgi:transposase InsO family protein
MNVHKNARSCPASRALLIDRVLRGGRVTAAASSVGLSERRAREWIRRGRAQEPLTDRSSRPRRTKRLPAETYEQVLQLRRQRMTLAKIAELVGIGISSVGRICRAHGLNRLRLIDAVLPPPVRRYEREWPGELLHIDIKKLGRFKDFGHRATGQRSFASEGCGWERLHVAIDDASRLTYAEILPDERGPTAAGFLQRSIEWFAGFGVLVQRVMTDNGPAYLSHHFASTCRRLSLKHLRTRPYTPQTNGKVERMIQTLLREWAYRFAYETSDQRRDWLDPYLHFYNVHRRHSALAYNPPISRLDRNNVLAIDSYSPAALPGR